jgi:hypothetical protein
MRSDPSPRRPLSRLNRVLATLALVVASCGGAASIAATTTTTTPTNTTPTTTLAESGGCANGPNAIPVGANHHEIIDVDGDRRSDEAWISAAPSGAVEVGVVTSAGGGAVRSWDSASPVMRSFLVVQPNGSTPPLFLADDGRTVQLWAFDHCAIDDVLNVQGEPYEFSLGFDQYGTGVGCATVDATYELIGLNVTDESEKRVNYTSTVVSVVGTEARNGKVTSGSFTHPGDDTAIALLRTVACGYQTIDDNGISAPA